MSNEHVSNFTTPWLVRDVVYPLAATSLAMAQAAGLAFIAVAFSATYPVAAVIALSGIVALEGIATSRWLNGRERAFYEYTTYRISEFIAIAVFTRVVTWYAFGTITEGQPFSSVVVDASGYFTAAYLATLVVVCFAWARATGLDSLFTRLVIGEVEAELYRKYPSRSVREQYLPRRAETRASLARQLTSGWIWGGVFLVLCAAISSVQLRGLDDSDNPIGMTQLGLVPLMSVALAVYFGIGLWLVSCARQCAMNEWWLVSDARKDQGVDRSWTRAVIVMSIIVAVVATMLPTGNGVPLLAWLKVLAGAVGSALNTVITFVLDFLTNLLGTSTPESFDPPLPVDLGDTPLLPQTAPARVETVDVEFEPAGWTVLLTALGLVLVYFLRGRFALPLRYLHKLLRTVLEWLKNRKRSTAPAEDKLQAVSGQDSLFHGLDVLERLFGRKRRSHDGSVRARLAALYVDLANRATKDGVERAPGQTPTEYEPALSQRWPQAEQDIAGLTRSFNKARYSLADVTNDEFEAAEARLKRVKTSESS